MSEATRVLRASESLITNDQRRNSDAYETGNAGAVPVAAVLTMLAIQLAGRRSILMSVDLMTKLLLVGRIVTVRETVRDHVSRGFQAHEEQGNNDG